MNLHSKTPVASHGSQIEVHCEEIFIDKTQWKRVRYSRSNRDNPDQTDSSMISTTCLSVPNLTCEVLKF